MSIGIPRANAVKTAAASGRRIRGVHQTFAAPAVIEVLAALELDFVYLDGEHASGDAAYVHERCTDAVRNGQRRNEIDYLACFVREMNAQPKRLCDKEMKARLIRYSRSYFNLLSVQSVVLKMPIAQQMLEMEKQVGYGNDIQSALPEVKADDEIVDGLAALVQKNVLSAWDYGGFFSPNVPQPVAAKLAIIKPLGKVCK